jgi:4-amino-4-deoxy-L-arabinose transferase-like glycosyltransferase
VEVRPLAAPPGRVRPLLLFLLFAAALALRVVVLFELRELPTQRVLIEDAARYDHLARELLIHHWLPAGAFDQAPLYPYILAAVYALAGPAYGLVRLLQAAIDAGTVVLLALAAAVRLSPRAGIWTGVLATLYGPLVFQATLLLKETWVVFLLALVVWLLAPRDAAASARRVFAVGVLVGIAALLRENLLLLLPVLAGWILWQDRASTTRRRALVATSFCAAAILPLLPVVALNRKASGEWIVTSYQGGMNFLIGNARGGDGTYRPLTSGSQDPAQERADARRLAAGFMSQPGAPADPARLTPREVSRALWRAGGREIAAAPASWARLMLRKTRLFWQRYEIPDAEGYDLYRAVSPVLRLCFLDLGWLLPFAAAGLVLARNRAASFTVVGLGIFFSVIVFFVFARYRLPVVVAVLPLAGGALADPPGSWREAGGRKRTFAALAFLAAAAAAWLPAWSHEDLKRQQAVLRYNQGSAAITLGELESAARQLDAARRSVAAGTAEMQAALRLDPLLFRAYLGQAAALHREGVFAAAAGDGEAARTAYASALTALAAGARQPGWSDDVERVALAAELERAIRAHQSENAVPR